MHGSMTGRVFNNRYQITDRIGIGGMAEVYQAQDRVLGRRVAIKVMLPQYASDPEFTRRFRQEAASAANLSSPYIVNVYDWGNDDGTYYIVMEYVRGSDLKSAIVQRGPINQRKVAEIGSQVCQALSVAHGQDIIHRDIKPQNIMIQPDGNIKVMDFGIARAKNSVGQRTSAVLGTAHYISPEQAQGKDLTATSDIYSLGVVLYEAATGKLPFDGPDAISVATKQVNEYPALPSEINPDIDSALEAIIMRALEKDPNARFAHALEMKQALNDYLSGRANAAFTQQQTQFIGYRNNVPPMDTGTIVLPHTTSGMKPVISTEEEKKPKRGKGIIIVALLAVILACAFAANAFLKGGTDLASVPDVSGETTAQATKDLQDAGFKVGSQTAVYSETVDEGLVVDTDPEGGKKAEIGSTVNLLVSQGMEQSVVPDLNGLSASEAQAALKRAGLTAKAGTSKNSDDVEKGKVMEQDPAAGDKVEVGTTVTYVISLGSESGNVPDVVGDSQEAAIATLQNAGFNAVVNDSAYSDTVPEGYVVSQSPKAGENLEPGGTIALTISLGSNGHTVDAVVSPYEGGSVSLSATEVQDGEGVNYTINVNDGYTIASVTDNFGGSYEAAASGYIPNITADTTIYVNLAAVGNNVYADAPEAAAEEPAAEQPAAAAEEPAESEEKTGGDSSDNASSDASKKAE